ncbi:MAG: MATE family efflux transporter [Paludibacterium sp.]|uniref:MATE family efflux transporter n=1 Tax=Paludibacterium sp. TaxID=1917523 RepID=UPI0025D27B9E|nr:MATE family efflux transporter [Paludibacterium sp.]MBV8045526.1 MATE family efflux transporter [Paludibacterium sp.]MBV8647983.1 MATE family efflux transporter [Paludibacterium sp.]
MLAVVQNLFFLLLRPLGLGHARVWFRELRPILRMSLPLILSQAAQIGIMFIDSILMGRLGPAMLASGALALSSYFFCLVLIFGLCAAAGNLVALAHGRDDKRAVVAATRAGLMTTLTLSILIGSLLWHAEPIMLALGQQPDNAHRAASFLRILVWGLPFSMLFLTLRSFASGIGNPGPVPFITVSSLLIAPCIGFVLSQGVGSWPGLGLNGIAISSVITYAYTGLVFALVVTRNPVFTRYHLFAGLAACDFAAIRPLLKLGIPTSGTLAMESGLFSSAAYLMGALGTAELAAHQSMMQIVIASFTIPIGLMQGVSMCVGQAAGAGDFLRVKHLGSLGQMLGVLWSLFTCAILWLFPQLVLALFLPLTHAGAAAARQVAVTLIPLVGLLLIFDAWQTIANGVLRALKDAHSTLAIFAFGCWGVGMPLAWWLSRHVIGAMGVWAGMVVGLACVTVLLIMRFRRVARELQTGRRRL